jgi:hypothetical protein
MNATRASARYLAGLALAHSPLDELWVAEPPHPTNAVVLAKMTMPTIVNLHFHADVSFNLTTNPSNI